MPFPKLNGLATVPLGVFGGVVGGGVVAGFLAGEAGAGAGFLAGEAGAAGGFAGVSTGEADEGAGAGEGAGEGESGTVEVGAEIGIVNEGAKDTAKAGGVTAADTRAAILDVLAALALFHN